MLPPLFHTVFWAVFILPIILIAVFWVVFIIRMIKTAGGPQEQTGSGNQPIVKEKEIIREIVKIRSANCGNLCNEKLDKCPHCGGKNP